MSETPGLAPCHFTDAEPELQVPQSMGVLLLIPLHQLHIGLRCDSEEIKFHVFWVGRKALQPQRNLLYCFIPVQSPNPIDLGSNIM